MKKIIIITFQTVFYLLSWTTEVWLNLMSNTKTNLIIINSIFCILTYILWKKSTNESIIKSISSFTLLELIRLYGENGNTIFERFNLYCKSTLLSPIMIISTLILLLIIKKQESINQNNQ
jgi:hypothetical protein